MRTLREWKGIFMKEINIFKSVAAHPACQTYSCSCAYLVMRKNCLRMNTHETFVRTNVNYRTENQGQSSKITFFNRMTLTFDLWPWPSNLLEMSSRSIPVSNFVTIGQCCKFLSPSHPRLPVLGQGYLLWEAGSPGGRPKNAISQLLLSHRTTQFAMKRTE